MRNDFRVPQLARHSLALTSLSLFLVGVLPAKGQDKPLIVLKQHTGWIGALALSPDRKTLASGSAEGTVKLWDVAGGEVKATMDARTGEVRSLAFSPDGKVIAAGVRYGTVKLWDTATGKEKATLRGHVSDVWALGFTPDGKA